MLARMKSLHLIDCANQTNVLQRKFITQISFLTQIFFNTNQNIKSSSNLTQHQNTQDFFAQTCYKKHSRHDTLFYHSAVEDPDATFSLVAA